MVLAGAAGRKGRMTCGSRAQGPYHHPAIPQAPSVADPEMAGSSWRTPTELFAASLAACVAFYAGRFLRRHGLTADWLRVDCHALHNSIREAPEVEIGLAAPATAAAAS
jgi:organic hydroperoxide reductase OsmC/OhrA